MGKDKPQDQGVSAKADRATRSATQAPAGLGHSAGIADADDPYWDYEDSECGNCGGEGFTYGCSWDWQCDTWDGDSCLCTRRCEWCNPLTAAEIAERNKLRDVLATALAKDKVAEMRAGQASEAPELPQSTPSQEQE